MGLTVSRVVKTDNFEKIAELIYITDPYLYPDLFGSLEQAKKLLPVLLLDPKSTFYYKYLYVAKLDNEIVGVVSIVPDKVEWKFNIIRMAYLECGFTMNEAVHEVNKYFEDTFNRIGVCSSVCNVCVDSNCRGQGIGSFIVQKLIATVGSNNIELSVLKDNVAAVKLYTKFGFIIVKECYEYGGYQKPKVLCYSMVRFGDRNRFQ